MTKAESSGSTLRAALDEIIPARDESLPGAGTLGVGAWVEAHLGDATELVAAGLATLEELARARGVAEYAVLPAEERKGLLEQAGAAHPGLIESLVFHAYSGYYQHPRVAVAIGIPPRPPYPEGYELEAGDLGLLEKVREREKYYRDA